MKRDSLKRNIFFSLVLLTSACALQSFKLHAEEIQHDPVFVEGGFDASEKAFIQETYERIQTIASEVKAIHDHIEKPTGWGVSKIILFLEKKIKEINDTILQPLKQKVVERSKRSSSDHVQKALTITSDIAQELHGMLKQLHTIVNTQKNKGHLLMGLSLKNFLVSVSKNNIPKLDRQLAELYNNLKSIPETADLQAGMEVIITKLRELKSKLDEPSDTSKVLALIKMVLDRR